VFLFLTLKWNESYCLRYKQDKLPVATRNYILLSKCVCVCRKLSAAAVVAAGAAGGGGRGGDVI
jgi:hypothetical protein